jgi:hypothetical protein
MSTLRLAELGDLFGQGGAAVRITNLRQRMVLLDAEGREAVAGTPRSALRRPLDTYPEVEIDFHLDEGDRSAHTLSEASWALADAIASSGLVDRLADGGGSTRARIAVEVVSYVSRRGARAGEVVTYLRPQIEFSDPPS